MSVWGAKRHQPSCPRVMGPPRFDYEGVSKPPHSTIRPPLRCVLTYTRKQILPLRPFCAPSLLMNNLETPLIILHCFPPPFFRGLPLRILCRFLWTATCKIRWPSPFLCSILGMRVNLLSKFCTHPLPLAYKEAFLLPGLQFQHFRTPGLSIR